ncbi:hypothetical protein SY83_15965 [Paenibacillus swuensis]|uniref:Uncharacterized protein n=1 Tax=Paenibacillus swuensis TaxID=1178515 RepID=A0A172TPM1_9BACL|nr:hypothetical protein SY83_15965 [Paenibacillus swuensis]
MDERELLFGLHQVPSIGWKSIRKLVLHTRSLTELLNMKMKDEVCIQLPLEQHRKEALCQSFTTEFIKQRIKLYRESGIQVVTILDKAYPEVMKESSEPPWVLYARGKVELMNMPLIAMVGARTPTAYGRKAAEELAAALVKAEIGVVSGLARGIDSCAHQGTLNAGGATIAVLGTGIDVVYPPENRALYNSISERGLVLSEFPMGTPSKAGMFPQRNRIIAGMSLGTIVVEAAKQSGSLITAEYAFNENREVFAVPGYFSSPKSQGTHELIKNGKGRLICSIGDILEELSYLKPGPVLGKHAVPAVMPEVELTSEERQLMEHMTIEGITLDELHSRSNIEFGHLHALLLHLLIKKQIKQLPGSCYALF